MTGAPWRAERDGLRVALRVQPGARADRLMGLELLADGSRVVKLGVTAPPEGGQANAAVVKLLAKRLRLAKSDIEIHAGHTGRRKSVRLYGDPQVLAVRLADALELSEDEMPSVAVASTAVSDD